MAGRRAKTERLPTVNERRRKEVGGEGGVEIHAEGGDTVPAVALPLLALHPHPGLRLSAPTCSLSGKGPGEWVCSGSEGSRRFPSSSVEGCRCHQISAPGTFVLCHMKQGTVPLFFALMLYLTAS